MGVVTQIRAGSASVQFEQFVTLHRRHDGEPLVINCSEIKTATPFHYGGTSVELKTDGVCQVRETHDEIVAALANSVPQQASPPAVDPNALPTPWEKFRNIRTGELMFISIVHRNPTTFINNNGWMFDQRQFADLSHEWTYAGP